MGLLPRGHPAAEPDPDATASVASRDGAVGAGGAREHPRPDRPLELERRRRPDGRDGEGARARRGVQHPRRRGHARPRRGAAVAARRAATARRLPTTHPRRPAGTCPPGKRPSIRHFTSNPTIDFESDTRARVRTYYQVLSSFGLDHWGRYLDEFGVVDGEWLITRRTVTTEGVDPDGWAAVPGVSEPGAPRRRSRARRSATCSRRSGTREPDALAYVDGEQRLTYGAVARRRRLARRRTAARAAWRPVTSSRSGCRRASTTRSRTPRARVSARSRPASTPASVPARSPRSSSAASRSRCCTRATRSRFPAAHPLPR